MSAASRLTASGSSSLSGSAFTLVRSSLPPSVFITVRFCANGTSSSESLIARDRRRRTLRCAAHGNKGVGKDTQLSAGNTAEGDDE